MALRVLTAPPLGQYLVSMATLKAELGIDAADESNDTLLWGMLRRATDAIGRTCGRPFWGVGQYQETLRGNNSQLLALTCTPVLSVTQVLRDQEVLSAWSPTVALDDSYRIEDSEAGALYNPTGWGRTAGLLMWGSEAYGSRYILAGGQATLQYTVTYTAGYLLPDGATFPDYDATAGNTLDTAHPPSTVAVPALLNTPATPMDAPPLPGAVEEACLVTLKAWWWGRLRDPALTSQRTGEESETYASAAGMGTVPPAALGLLRDYRRIA